MNATSLTRHLLIKDLRHQRVWVALAWLVALLLPLAALRVNMRYDRSEMPLTLGTGAFFLLAFLVIVRVIRVDAPGREFHFLATRPVPWTTVLAGKILFIGLFIVVPVWIAQLEMIYAMKIPAGFGDIALVLVEDTIYTGALFCGIALFSMFLRGLPVILVSMAGAALLIYFGITFLHERSFHGATMPRMPDVALDDCRFLVLYMAIIVSVVATASLRHSHKINRKSRSASWLRACCSASAHGNTGRITSTAFFRTGWKTPVICPRNARPCQTDPDRRRRAERK